jgi:hypothetical protein
MLCCSALKASSTEEEIEMSAIRAEVNAPDTCKNALPV